MGDLGKLKAALERYKLPLLILLFGIVLMLLPTGHTSGAAASGEPTLQETLSDAGGVGEAVVLISEHGVVVVCEGADSAEVQMNILQAVKSYTGFGADRVTILKAK